jgi:hypothetical protein
MSFHNRSFGFWLPEQQPSILANGLLVLALLLNAAQSALSNSSMPADIQQSNAGITEKAQIPFPDWLMLQSRQIAES